MVRARSALRATFMGIAVALLLSSTALADTCCANRSVKLDPPSAMPGDTVLLTGLRCLRYDGTGSLPLNLSAFWLATGHRPAEAHPGDTPGNLPYPDLPPVEEWLSFESAPAFDSAKTGDATIIVPDLPDGLYQLWWLCDNGGGPGSGIHYSPGPRLAIGVPPDTATNTATAQPGPSGPPAGHVWLILGLGATVFLAMLRPPAARHPKGGTT